MRFTRLLTVSLLGAAALSTACSGELYLSENDAVGDFDAADRDHPGGDTIDGDDDNGGDSDFDADSDIDLGDQDFGGDGDDDSCPDCCGFLGECEAGKECVIGVCIVPCLDNSGNPQSRCGEAGLCCRDDTTECCDVSRDPSCVTDHCRTPCPLDGQPAGDAYEHCGARDELCCDVTAGLTCGAELTCVTSCSATDGPLCGNSDDGTSPGVCCNGHGTSDPNDDDVCLFGTCVPRGSSCTSFLDCPTGFYCEDTLHDPGSPSQGVCLPNTFPPGTPICQAAPTNLFVPTTEFAWVGVQLVPHATLKWKQGDLVRPCTNASDTYCYREPCTNIGTFALDGNNCFRSVESIPTTADLDKDGIPEVVIKAYADNTFDNSAAHANPNDNGNLLVVIDGRADVNLPTSSDPTQLSNTHRSKFVIYGETRGHLALGDIDGDPELEIVAAHHPGVRAYDLSGVSVPTDNTEVNVLKWWTESGDANNSFSAGAPSLNDMNNDGVPEVVIGAVVIDAAPATNNPTPLVQLGAANPNGSGAQVADSQGGQCTNNGTTDCFEISTVADVNGDNVPELLIGSVAYAVGNGGVSGNGGTWTETAVWTAHHDALATASSPCADNHSVACASEKNRTLGTGFPGVGDFVDNTKPPYNRAKNTPEVAVVYNGSVFILSGEDGTVLRTPTPCSPKAATATTNECLTIFTQSACTADANCQWDNAELFVQPLGDKGGPPNIADFDGDGHVEVSFSGAGCMVVVDPQCFVGSVNTNARDAMPNITGSGCSVTRPTVASTRICTIDIAAGIGNEYGLSWMYQTQDASSAVTGTSVFDFQGDLKAEVLYNDECFFRVFEGSDASILYERPNDHRTATEYPIVVDVDGDGNSEIVVVSTGDQGIGRDRCGNQFRAGHSKCDGKANGNSAGQCGAITDNTYTDPDTGNHLVCRFDTVANACIPTINYAEHVCAVAGGNCNTTDGCQNVSGVCAPYAYYRDVYSLYKSSACDCLDHTTQDDCNAGRGCTWNSGTSTCGLVDAAGTYCSSETTVTGCVAKSKDCLWDAYQGASGVCEQHPRDQDYICKHATWGVTSFGDPQNLWVRTLPYWHEHDFHITNVTHTGDPVPDWDVCYDNQNDGNTSQESTCTAISDAPTCNGNSSCIFGSTNPSFYNNFRQNVPGFVPLNAPDLKVTNFIADQRQCPPQLTLIATVFNNGRAGIIAGTPVGFYRLTNVGESPQTTAAGTAVGTPTAGESFATLTGAPTNTIALPVSLLPGQSTEVSVVYTLLATEEPVNLNFRVIANPQFLTNPGGSETDDQSGGDRFECDPSNNYSDLLNLDCLDTGS